MTLTLKRLLLVVALPLALVACASSSGGNTTPNTVSGGDLSLNALSPLALSLTTLGPGESRQFVVTVGGQPPQIGQLQWVSNNPQVLSVSSTGYVTALASGTATVRMALSSNPSRYLEFLFQVNGSSGSGRPALPGGDMGEGTVAQQILTLTNAARAQGYTCGGVYYPPASPLTYNARLETAAQRHAYDMAARNYFNHISPEGQSVSERVQAAGYAWRVVAENISAGQTSAAEAVSGWLSSPEHCKNIMDPALKQLGVGYSYSASSTYNHYWVQNFGTP